MLKTQNPAIRILELWAFAILELWNLSPTLLEFWDSCSLSRVPSVCGPGPDLPPPPAPLPCPTSNRVRPSRDKDLRSFPLPQGKPRVLVWAGGGVVGGGHLKLQVQLEAPFGLCLAHLARC